MKNSINTAVVLGHGIWSQAPLEAFHWERLPSGKCIWHCRTDEKSFSKKAPDFEIEQNSLWRDADKQKDADQMRACINTQLSKLNIVLA